MNSPSNPPPGAQSNSPWLTVMISRCAPKHPHHRAAIRNCLCLAASLCSAGLLNAQTAGPVPFELTLSAHAGRASLRWAAPGLPYPVAYTIQSSDSLTAVTNWLPAPATVWPIPTNQWTDPQLTRARSRFYNLIASPAAAERGKLLSNTFLRSMSFPELQTLFLQAQVPFTPLHTVRLYKLDYETVNPFDVRTVASGLLALPEGTTGTLPLVSYQHGTIVRKQDVPSTLQAYEAVIGVALSSSGYVAALPDYVGLGDSPGLHPFVHARSEATAAIDLLRAVRTFCATNNISLNGQLFLMGYSQGGHATMALHKEIEEFYPDEFSITASAPMAGPYDLSGVTAADFLSGRAMPNPYYLLYILAAYQSIYQLAPSLADLFVSPYDRTLPPLLDGQHDGSDLNAAMGQRTATNVLKPQFLESFKTDPNHPLRIALRANDLYDWTPRAPLRLYHCDGDQDVLYANSRVATNQFHARGVEIPLINPAPGADHGGCAEPSLLRAKEWFDSLANK